MNEKAEILIPIAIIGGLAVLYFAVERADKAVVPPSSGIIVGGSPLPVNFQAGVAAETATDSGITKGLGLATSAVSKIPVIGSIAGSILGTFTSIAGAFTAHHTQAVAVEASTLNSAIPAFLQTVEQTMYELNEGQITPAQAIANLNNAQSVYYASVSGIIKKSGPCANPCTITANGAIPRCCNTASTCNAACCNGCVVVEQSVINLTRIIKAGSGTYSISGTPDNGAIQGTPGVTITYTPYIAPPEYDVLLAKLGSIF